MDGRGAVQDSLELVEDTDRIDAIIDGSAPEQGVRNLRSQRSAAWLAELVDL